MECNLCDLEQMPRNRLIIEAVACQQSLGEMLDALEMNGDIDRETVVGIKGMEAFRNRVVAGDTPEIDADIAFSFLQQAFDISKNMTKKLLIQQN